MNVSRYFLLLSGTLLLWGCTKVAPSITALNQLSSNSSFTVFGSPATATNIALHTLTFLAPGMTKYWVLTGPAGTTSCLDEGSYSGPYAIAQNYSLDHTGSPDGNYRLCILTEDLLGVKLTGAQAHSQTWLLDRVAPSTTALTPNPPLISRNLNPQFAVISPPANEVTAYRWKIERVADGGSCTDSGYSAARSTGDLIQIDFTGRPEGEYLICVIGRDLAGNEQSPIIHSWTKDTIAPAAPTLTLLSAAMSTSTFASLGISCDAETYQMLLTEDNSVPSLGDAGWSVCPSTSDFTLSGGDGPKTIYGWAKDFAGNISIISSPINLTQDLNPPFLNTLQINAGATRATTPFVTLMVRASDAISTQVQFRFREMNAAGDCQAQFANNDWSAMLASNTNHEFPWTLTWTSGDYKICAWAKDAQGHISQISPSLGNLGVDAAEIQLVEGTAPDLSDFTVTNGTAGANFGTTTYAAGNIVQIHWAASDAEGLPPFPVTLEYTTDNTNWLPISNSHVAIPNGTLSFSYTETSFVAPGSTYFRVRTRAKDDDNLTSPMLVSQMQNTSAWSIYAGNTDRGVGGHAEWVSLQRRGCSNSDVFAIHPKTQDLYVVDDPYGIVRVDSKTGLTSTFLKHGGTTTLGTSGTLMASDAMVLVCPSLTFDKNGQLYVREGGSVQGASTSRLIYRFNIGPTNTTYQIFAGGSSTSSRGTSSDASSPPQNLYITGAGIRLSENNELFVTTNCGGTSWSTSTGVTKVVKITQDGSGNSFLVTDVAGNCVKGTTADGSAAVSASLTPVSTWPAHNWSIELLSPDGQTLIIRNQVGSVRIINHGIITVPAGGTFGPSGTLNVSGLAYDKVNDRIVLPGLDGSLQSCQTNGTSCAVVAGINSSAGCQSDGVAAASACVNASTGVQITTSGRIVFMDNANIDYGADPMPFRIRMLDDAMTVRSLAGHLPAASHSSDPLQNKILAQSIAYKNATDGAQLAFPVGLYFTSSVGGVFGRINDTAAPAKPTEILWGNQQMLPFAFTAGNYDAPISPDRNLQSSYGRLSMAFDPDGLPWLRVGNGLLTSMNFSNQNIKRMYGGANPWYEATNIGSTSLGLYGGVQNMTFAPSTSPNPRLFLLGKGNVSSGSASAPLLRAFDYGTNVAPISIMGDNSNSGDNVDLILPGLVSTATLNTTCSTFGCAIQYAPVGSKAGSLILGEGAKLRAIENVNNPSGSTLTTLITVPGGKTVVNLILSPDGNRIFFLVGSTQTTANEGLYCLTLSGASTAMCPNSLGWALVSNLATVKLGPVAQMKTIGKGGNQMTWKGPTTLLISNQQGEIYQFETAGFSGL